MAPESERAKWYERETAAERYERDPAFHAIVQAFYHHIREGMFTPTELREACILAATMYEMYHVRPMIFGADELHRVMRKDKP